MADNDFFKVDQYNWFCEFAEYNLPEIFIPTLPHDEKFTFEDVPF